MKIQSIREATPKRLNHILQVLQQGQYEIATAGWTQGIMRDHKGYCAIGALHVRTTFSPHTSAARWWAHRYLEDVIPTANLAQWNDAPNRTKKQVLAAFEKAIKLVKKEMPNVDQH